MAWLWWFLGVCYAAYAVALDDPSQCSKISEEERVDCLKSDQGSCTAARCCWSPVSPNPDNSPWCFYSDRKVAQCTLGADPKQPFSDSEMAEVMQHFEANLDVQGSGMVVAAPDHNTGPGGDYYYAWMRDGALSMHAYLQTSAQFSAEVEKKFDSWLSWAERSQNEASPNGISILAEPKFLIPGGEPFPGGWCRPQTDGPGLRSITLMAYAKAKQSIAQRAWALVKQDLDYVVANHSSIGCDLWEEVQSEDFFWNHYTMRKALLQGSEFASTVAGDTQRAAQYEQVAKTLTDSLSNHVKSDGFVFESTNREVDTAVIEAFNVGDMADGIFAPLSKEVISTLVGLSQSFCRDYKLNQDAVAAGTPGVLFGRYKGDGYDGGNPWVLLTASAANLLYRQAESFANGNKPSPEASAQLAKLLGREVSANNLLGAGDAILLLMRKYLTNGMHMNEQIDRDTGELKSAKDLTWNYANVLKAMKARRAAEQAANYTLYV